MSKSPAPARGTPSAGCGPQQGPGPAAGGRSGEASSRGRGGAKAVAVPARKQGGNAAAGREDGAVATKSSAGGRAPSANSDDGAAAPVRAVRVERNGGGLGVVYSNRVRERIAGGGLEMRDAGGKVVIDRPATATDIERVRENIRRSGLGSARDASLPDGSDIDSVAV